MELKDLIGTNSCIHCRTREEFIAITNRLRDLNYNWPRNSSTNHEYTYDWWDNYKEDTIIAMEYQYMRYGSIISGRTEYEEYEAKDFLVESPDNYSIF